MGTCPGQLESILKTHAGREEGESLAVTLEVIRHHPEILEVMWVESAGIRRIPSSLQTHGGNLKKNSLRPLQYLLHSSVVAVGN